VSRVIRLALGGAVLGAVIGGVLGMGIAKKLNKPAIAEASGSPLPKLDTNHLFQLGLAIFSVIRQLIELGR
jgi:hypothetical protein